MKPRAPVWRGIKGRHRRFPDSSYSLFPGQLTEKLLEGAVTEVSQAEPTDRTSSGAGTDTRLNGDPPATGDDQSQVRH